MKKGAIWVCLLLGFLCLPVWGWATEEARPAQLETEDYIFVPAQEAPSTSPGVWLLVKGKALSAQGTPQEVPALTGAEFGLYAPNAEGEMLPWPDADNPGKPAVFTSDTAPAFIPLPTDTKVYLRQLSAPEGYFLTDESYLPLSDGQEVEIWNVQRGALALTAANPKGQPLSGAAFQVKYPDGTTETLTTGVEGTVLLSDLSAGAYTVTAQQAPAHTLLPDAASQTVQVEDASMAQATFTFPDMGSLSVQMVSQRVDDDGQVRTTPLSGLVLSLLDAKGKALTGEDGSLLLLTGDASGNASIYLPSGSYQISAPEQLEGGLAFSEPVLAFTIEDTKVTRLTLKAVPGEGALRIRSQALRAAGQPETPLTGLAFSLLDASGNTVWEDKTDSNATALHTGLPAGAYTLVIGEIPGDFALPGPDAIPVQVERGALTEQTVIVSASHKQTYLLQGQSPADTGKMQRTSLPNISYEVMAGDESVAQGITDEKGYFTLELPMGDYTLRFPQNQDALAAYQTDEAVAFSLPQQAAIVLPSALGMAQIQSLDANGRRLTGAAYRLTGPDKVEAALTTDARGEVYTPALRPGAYQLTSTESPKGYAAVETTIHIVADTVDAVQVVFPSLGTLELTLRQTAIDENAQQVEQALSGAEVKLYTLSGFGDRTQSPILMEEQLLSDGTGIVRTGARQLPRLAAGKYRALVEGYEGSVDFTLQNDMRTEASLLLTGHEGALQLRLTSSQDGKALSGARFLLVSENDSGETTLRTDGEGTALATALPEGNYTLSQERAPTGYGLTVPVQVTIQGGKLSELSLQNHLDAGLAVEKLGLTYDVGMQESSKPLAGEYALFTQEGDAYRPYPNGAEQVRLLAGEASISLPATPEGVRYYLLETSAPEEEYLPDTDYHEVTLISGQSETVTIRRTAHTGYLRVRNIDAATEDALPGARFALFALTDGVPATEPVLLFTLAQEAYQNPTPLPAGAYLLRMLEAAPGYMLDATVQPTAWAVEILPHTPETPQMAEVVAESESIPQQTPEVSEPTVTAALTPTEEGPVQLEIQLTGGENPQDAMLSSYALVLGDLNLSAATASDIPWALFSLSLAPASDATGPLGAHLWLALWQGGWLYGGEVSLETAQTLDLTNAPSPVRAVRIVYYNPQTGAETVGKGFSGAEASVTLQLYNETAQTVQPQVSQSYHLRYQDETGEPDATAPIAQDITGESLSVEMTTAEILSAGEPATGRITGRLWLEQETLDGTFGTQDTTEEISQVRLQLLGEDGNLASDWIAPAVDGSFAFEDLPLGTYGLDAQLPEGWMALDASLWNARYVLDAAQCSAFVEIPLLNASQVSGMLFRDVDGDGLRSSGEGGLSGITVYLLEERWDGQRHEVAAVETGADGGYTFSQVLPGAYRLEMALPEDMAMTAAAGEEAADSMLVALAPGQQEKLPEQGVAQLLSLSGYVWLDEDGNGLYEQSATLLPDITVRLYAADAAQSLPLQTVTTGENGSFEFRDVLPGDYIVRVVLPDNTVPTLYVTGGNCIHLERAGLGRTEIIALRMDEPEPRIPAGVSTPMELSVFTWLDSRFTGTVRRNSKGVEGVTLELLRNLPSGLVTVARSLSDGSGETVFSSLSPGEYVLRYTLPDNYYPSPKSTEGAGVLLPTAWAWERIGETQPFTLTAGQGDTRYTFALLQPVSISGTVWEDTDDNGLQDEDEQGWAGARVLAMDEQGETVLETTSDAGGAYQLSPLLPGVYTVRFMLPEGYAFSGTRKTYERGTAQESDQHQSETIALTLRSETPLEDINAGVLALSSLSGRSRVAEGDMPGLPGTRVQLEKAANGAFSVVQETTTGEDGRFDFENLRPGEYRLTLVAPGDYVWTTAQEGAQLMLAEGWGRGTAVTESFALSTGENRVLPALHALVLSGLEGLAFDDTNGDGLWTEDEPALRGVYVELLAEGEAEPVDSMTTDRDGTYSFLGLTPGVYSLRFTLPGERVFTQSVQGGSRIPRQDTQTATLSAITLAMGQVEKEIYIGALQLARASGAVYLDENDDGVQQTFEVGIPGVTILLRNTATDAKHEVQTDLDGTWRVTGLEPGSYTLQAALPEGYVFARTPVRTREKPIIAGLDAQEGETQAFTLSFGESMSDIAIGAVRTGSFSGLVYNDAEDTGVYTEQYAGIQDAEILAIDLLSGATHQGKTGKDGEFELSGLRPGSYALTVSLPEDRMFSRAVEGGSAFAGSDDASMTVEPLILGMGQDFTPLSIGSLLPIHVEGALYLDENKNQRRDASEKGLGRATVQLYHNDELLLEQQTLEDGSFRFDGLRPGDIHLSVLLPERAMFTTEQPVRPLEALGVEGVTTKRTLKAGQYIEALDVPLLLRGSISGSVFEDQNNNGQYDATEPALPDAKVQLLRIENGEETTVSTQYADEQGAYAFGSLPPGEYMLRFTLPEGYLYALMGQGPLASIAVEEDELTAVSEHFQLDMGQTIINKMCGGILPGMVGDTVWLDENGNGLQDDGEPPVSGVTIVLYRVVGDVGTEMARRESDAYGFYRFEGLRPGMYQLEAYLPEGYAFTKVEELLDEINSDIVDVQNGRGRTAVFEVHSAEQRRNIDIGLVEAP